MRLRHLNKKWESECSQKWVKLTLIIRLCMMPFSKTKSKPSLAALVTCTTKAKSTRSSKTISDQAGWAQHCDQLLESTIKAHHHGCTTCKGMVLLQLTLILRFLVLIWWWPSQREVLASFKMKRALRYMLIAMDWRKLFTKKGLSRNNTGVSWSRQLTKKSTKQATPVSLNPWSMKA